jgi:hypothetical protein
VAKAVSRREALALKVLRNICQHGGQDVHRLLIGHIHDLVNLIMVRIDLLPRPFLPILAWYRLCFVELSSPAAQCRAAVRGRWA